MPTSSNQQYRSAVAERTPTQRHTEYIQQHKHNVQIHSLTYIHILQITPILQITLGKERREEKKKKEDKKKKWKRNV